MPKWTSAHINNSFSSEHFSTLPHNSNLHALFSPTEHVALTTSMVPLNHYNSLFLKSLFFTHSFSPLSLLPPSTPFLYLFPFSLASLSLHSSITNRTPLQSLKGQSSLPLLTTAVSLPIDNSGIIVSGLWVVPREIGKCIFTFFFP